MTGYISSAPGWRCLTHMGCSASPATKRAVYHRRRHPRGTGRQGAASAQPDPRRADIPDPRRVDIPAPRADQLITGSKWFVFVAFIFSILADALTRGPSRLDCQCRCAVVVCCLDCVSERSIVVSEWSV